MKRYEKAVREENEVLFKAIQNDWQLATSRSSMQKWWREHPSLHAIAQEVTVILTRHGTEADVEKLFLRTKLLVKDNKSRLTTEHLQARMQLWFERI